MPQSLYLTLNAAEKHTQFLISCVDYKDSTDKDKNDAEKRGITNAHILYSEMSTQIKASTEFLIPAIDTACQKLAIKINDIHHIAAVTGPGNFMGIRLTAVTASALMRVLPKNSLQAPLNYMQCLAQNLPLLADFFAQTLCSQAQQEIQAQNSTLLNALQNIKGKVVRVLTTATKNSVHLCDFTFTEEHGYIIPLPNFSTILYDLENHITQTESSLEQNISDNSIIPDFIIGSGLHNHESFFKTRFPRALCITENTLQILFDKQDKSFLNLPSKEKNSKDFFEIPIPLFAHTPSMQALHNCTVSTYTKWQKEDLNPLYLKACDALQNLDHIATMQGRDPKNAHSHLEKLMHTPL